MVTSGNYEKYKMIDGKRYSHIIDPRSGWPASGLASVTIFAPQAELADALLRPFSSWARKLDEPRSSNTQSKGHHY